MKKTAEEILKENTKRTLNIVEDSPLHVAVIKAMEEYRSQSVLPSEKKKKRIANNFFQWTENLNKGDSLYSELLRCKENNLRLQDQINSLLASRDARIKELEEDLYRINLLNKQYSNFRNEVLEIPDELIKQIDNKHFPF